MTAQILLIIRIESRLVLVMDKLFHFAETVELRKRDKTLRCDFCLNICFKIHIPFYHIYSVH